MLVVITNYQVYVFLILDNSARTLYKVEHLTNRIEHIDIKNHIERQNIDSFFQKTFNNNFFPFINDFLEKLC